jgi:hypothetical protein
MWAEALGGRLRCTSLAGSATVSGASERSQAAISAGRSAAPANSANPKSWSGFGSVTRSSATAWEQADPERQVHSLTTALASPAGSLTTVAIAECGER